MTATLAELGFDIKTDNIKKASSSLDGLSKSSDGAEKSASKFSRGYSASMAAVKKTTLAATAAAVGLSAAIIKYTNEGLANIDAQAKLARAQNATADSIRALQLAASDAGLEGMEGSLTRLTRRLGAAQMGNKEYGDTVKALGLDIETLASLDADDKIAAIADAVKSSGISYEESARHLQNLGFQQSNANAFFRQGGDAVRNARKEIEDYGLSLSAIDTAKVEAANDAWSRTSLAIEAGTNQLAVHMAPVIQTVAQYLNDAAKEGDGLGESIENGVDIGVRSFAYLADVVASVDRVFEVLGKSIAAGMLGARVAILSIGVSLIEGPLAAVNTLIDAMNYFGADMENIEAPAFFEQLKRDATAANVAVSAATSDIHKTLMKPLPSGGILAHYEEVKKAANKSAVAVVASEKKNKKALVESAGDAGGDSGEEFTNEFEGQISSVADSLQDAITSGDWAGIGATIGATLASGIALAVGTDVSKSMGNNLGSAIAGPLMGAIAGGLAGLAAQKVSDWLNGSDYDPTADRQAAQGTGTILGSSDAKSRSIEKALETTASATSELVGINRSMLAALQSVQLGISGASARVSSGFSTDGLIAGAGANTMFDDLVGANLDALSALSLGTIDFKKLLGGSSKKKDEGINIIGGYIGDLVDETVVDAYATFRVRKNRFSKSSLKEKTQGLGDDVNDQFSLVFESVLDSVIEGASVFGIGASAAEGFKVDTAKLSLEGMDAGQKQAAIEEYFGTVFDNLSAHTIPWLTEFQQAGEGLGETLARVATETQVTQEAIKQMGIQFADLSGAELVTASSRLMELSGGMEQFISSMQGFISNFATASQQFEITQDSLTSAFDAANLSLPETRSGYYDLLKAQDGSTEAGAKNIATLLRLQSTASEYYDTLEEGAESALNAAKNSASATLAVSKSAAEAVNSALSGLVNPAISSGMSRDTALSSLSAMSVSGRIGSASDLSKLLGTATNIDANDFASFGEYIRAVSKTGEVLTNLKSVTDAKVTKDQQLLANIDKRIAEMTKRLVATSEASVKLEAKTARILERIELDGLPVQEA